MMRWLLLRGLTRESRHWGEFPETFGRSVGAAEVVALDLPGNGALHAQDCPADIGGMVAACRSAAARSGLAPPFGILAMSLGAMVASTWAAAHPDEVEAVVLVNTSMRSLSPFFHRLRPRNYARLLRLLLAAPSAPAVERAILAMTSRRHAGDAAVLSEWVRWRQACPVSRRNTLRQLLAAARFQAPSPTVPVLLLASVGDGLVDPRCSQRLAEHWQADLRVHPSAGHDLPLDDPRWVAATVAEWLSRRGFPVADDPAQRP